MKTKLRARLRRSRAKPRDKAGELLGNKDLEAEGEAEHLEGSIQEGAGKVRRKVGEAVEDVGKAVGGKK
jgi:uncharacterized protein YjbJ (UPF0337 family)